MVQLFFRIFPKTTRKSCTSFLAFCWFMGFLFGIILSDYTGGISASLMRSAAFGSVSIVSLLISSAFPFLIAAVAVCISKPTFLYPLAFLRSTVFAFVAHGVRTSFDASGWLFYYLLMFCDIGSLVTLYFYMVRHIDGLRVFSLSGTIPYIAALLLISSIDFYFVAPILSQLV